MSRRTKGGNIILREVTVPNQVAPGETFEATVQVSNGAAYINPWDPDKCGLAPPGYKIEVEASSGGTTRTKQDCITTTEVGTRDEGYTFVFTAPSDGSATVSANVKMRGSGKETGEVTTTVPVSSSSPAQSQDGSDSDSNPFGGLPTPGDGGGGGGGGGLSIPGFGGSGAALPVIGVLAVMLVVVVAS